jgi:hypothetical protein
MRHTSTGRKKKTNYWTKPKKKVSEFKPYVAPDTFRRSTPDYPSADSISHGSTGGTLTSQEKKDISSNYTIAPAYNKGAYQVIGPKNIKDIGK